MTTTTWEAPPLAPLTRPRRTRTRSGVLPTLWLGVLAVLAFWWTGTTASTGATPGGALMSLGELAGLLASYLVCAQLLLIGRVPWFERGIGFDRLVAWHRSLGTSVVLLVLTHVVLMIVGGSLLDGLSVWSEVPAVLATQPYLWPAVIGTILFLAVGISSARLARRHLSYEVWFAVHLTVYVGIFLAFAHQVAGGTHFVDSLVARGLWIVLYAGTAAALLTWRVALPLLAHRRFGMRVSAVVPEANGLASVWVHGHGLSRLGARGGQFFLVRFLTPGHRATAHPYSLSMAPTDDHLRFTVGALGDHSSAVADLRPGTRVQVEGPFGTFTADRATSDRALLVAGGAGVGPVRALAEELLAQGRHLVVLHRAHDAASLALAAEFTPSPGLTYVPVPGRRAQLGYDPLDAQHLLRLVPDIASRDVFVCGPPAMADAVARSARAVGVPRSAIHREEIDS
ncbi:ferredoxin reductase family protein [Cellulomonas humilata]|uniref:Ferric reductase n=1 Tax=Cellulomonas humilata TaxID=144055 RepID=A0ABU0EKL8_9CELL|nr:ferredoxin reductase family protein [Cellulomonas humilata]MDQ0375829.1 putative ferric reductase [Cellulomonas humilata]